MINLVKKYTAKHDYKYLLENCDSKLAESVSDRLLEFWDFFLAAEDKNFHHSPILLCFYECLPWGSNYLLSKDVLLLKLLLFY